MLNRINTSRYILCCFISGNEKIILLAANHLHHFVGLWWPNPPTWDLDCTSQWIGTCLQAPTKKQGKWAPGQPGLHWGVPKPRVSSIFYMESQSKASVIAKKFQPHCVVHGDMFVASSSKKSNSRTFHLADEERLKWSAAILTNHAMALWRSVISRKTMRLQRNFQTFHAPDIETGTKGYTQYRTVLVTVLITSFQTNMGNVSSSVIPTLRTEPDYKRRP